MKLNVTALALAAGLIWGGAVFLCAVLWTVLRTHEYSPEELAAFDALRPAEHVAEQTSLRPAARYRNGGLAWALAGILFWAMIAWRGWDKQLFVLAGARRRQRARLLYLSRSTRRQQARGNEARDAHHAGSADLSTSIVERPATIIRTPPITRPKIACRSKNSRSTRPSTLAATSCGITMKKLKMPM